MENLPEAEIWETVCRAYVLVVVNEPIKKLRIAMDIYALNGKLDISKALIIRTSVVADAYHIVVPVCARDFETLDWVIDLIMGLDGVNPIASLRLYTDRTIAPPDRYHPWPPHKALGYIPLDEANPKVGPQDFNLWG